MTNTRTSERVAFISPCGWGNLGDAAIQDSFIANVRAQLGDGVAIIGITQNPADTERRHGVATGAMEATTIGFLSNRSGSEPPRLFARIARRFLREPLHWRYAYRWLRGVSTLAVSGGGQLDDYWGGPWGVPFSLFKWTLLARLRGARVVVLSVGAGQIGSGLTTFFLRRAIRRASFATARDTRTAATIRDVLGLRVRVVPDLAFGHPARLSTRTGSGSAGDGIAVLPIGFLDPQVWPVRDEESHLDYVERLVDVIEQLAISGQKVRICVSDKPDVRTARLVLERLSEYEAVSFTETQTLDELLSVLGSASVVVASRLHAIILAHLLGIPSVALSYDWKVDEHMKSMGSSDFATEISTFVPAQVAALVRRASEEATALSPQISQLCGDMAREVVGEFESVFGHRDQR